MPIFPEELSQMEYFDHIRKSGLLTDDEFIELKELDEKIKTGVISDMYLGRNRLNELKEFFLEKRKSKKTDDEIKFWKNEILGIENMTTLDELLEEKYKLEMSLSKGTIFEAVLTNNENISFDKKTKLLFANLEWRREYIPFQFLLDSFKVLEYFYPDTFISDNGLFKNTEKIIEDHIKYKDLFYYYTDKSLKKLALSRLNRERVTIFSKKDILERKLLVDNLYMDKNFDQFGLLYSNREIKRIEEANKIMSQYYKGYLLYENKIVKIETEKLVKINIGDLFWIVKRSRRNNVDCVAIGKIINII